MSVLAALLADATPDDLALLAERLAPHLPSVETPDRWLRGAESIASYIDAPVSRVYALSSAGRIPVEHDGSTLIAQSSKLDAWLRDGGGRRP